MIYDPSVNKINDNGRIITLAALAIPTFFEFIFTQLLGTANTIMLSGYSQEGVAATSVANQIENIAICLINIIIYGMTILTSIELGKENCRKAEKIAGTSLISITVVSIIIGMVISFFSTHLINFMNLEGVAGKLSSAFLKRKALFLLLIMIKSVFNNILICNGYAKHSFISGLLTNILNVIYGYIVLYSPIAASLNGVIALAYAPIFIQPLPLLYSLFILIKKHCPFRFGFSFSSFKKILRMGTPGGLGLLSFTATQMLTTGFMASLGVTILNANVYISNIVNYTSKIGWAVAKGHGVLTGRYRGCEDYGKMKILYRQNMFIAVASNAILSVLAFIFCKPLISLFSGDSQILSIAIKVMAVDIIVEIARAVNNISEQSLNANGDVKTTFVVPLFTCWIFGVFLSYILGIKCGMGLLGCWLGFAVDEIIKATLYSLRWCSGKWKNTKI